MRPASSLGRPSGERVGLPFRAGDPIPVRTAPGPAENAHRRPNTETGEPAEPGETAETSEAPEEHRAAETAEAPQAPQATPAPPDGAGAGRRPDSSAEGEAAESEDVQDSASGEAADEMREFVEELDFWLEEEGTGGTGAVDEWLRGAALRIVGVGEESITFDVPDGRTIGPIPVPAGIAEQAEPGWQVRLTAARTGDTWHLHANA
ncbi:hypothetical protein [Cryptosporangium sp. NPDC051539]|uniref:hypothetical protein n=1 Tax=Cryptosporangium sp. NPDC051539 TaxID=3363962 RepID=UPI0037BC3486